MASLAEIRARLQAAESNKGGNNQTGGDNAIYPHWNIDEGQSATLRFLPDGNSKNTFFWVERAMIKLPFNGIKGEMDSKQVQVQVPCVEMWGEACPILAEVRTWFKDKSLEDMGRKYWKKRSYIMQGFVRENPLSDDKTPENPIRRFIIGPQIFQTIKSALMDPELEELPTDLMRGLDFRITKTSKGGYADYSTSKWARKESALTEEEQAAIEKHGLFDLNEFLPKKPSEAELRVIKEMFEASVDGQPYDPDRWGAYYRPAGVAAPAGSSTGGSASAAEEAAPAPVAKAAPVSTSSSFDEDEEVAAPTAPVAKPAAAPAGGNAQDILAMIRARQNKG
ncbi:MAG: hypothetical protein ACO24D_18535 [bacterium]